MECSRRALSSREAGPAPESPQGSASRPPAGRPPGDLQRGPGHVSLTTSASPAGASGQQKAPFPEPRGDHASGAAPPTVARAGARPEAASGPHARTREDLGHRRKPGSGARRTHPVTVQETEPGWRLVDAPEHLPAEPMGLATNCRGRALRGGPWPPTRAGVSEALGVSVLGQRGHWPCKGLGIWISPHCFSQPVTNGPPPKNKYMNKNIFPRLRWRPPWPRNDSPLFEHRQTLARSGAEARRQGVSPIIW